MQSPFYATPSDLLEVCTRVAQRMPLRFDRTGSFESATLNPTLLPSEMDLGTTMPHDGYLVTLANAAVSARRLETVHGTRFLVDELLNPASATLSLGYRPNAKLLTPGSIGTTAREGEGVQIVREFRKGMAKHFTKVRAYWVGPEALSLCRAGGRLTLSELSSPEFDLLLEEHDA